MVGVINPVSNLIDEVVIRAHHVQNSSVSLDTQKQDAAASQYMLAPGEAFPSEEGGVPAGDVDPTHNTTTSVASNTPGPSHKLSGGAIAGVVIGGIIVAGLVGAVFFLWGRNRSLLQFMRGNLHRSTGPQMPPGDQGYQSPDPSMSIYPSSGPNVPYAYDSPPYSKYPSHGHVQPPMGSPPLPAELPSPRNEKTAQGYAEMDNPASRPQDRDSPIRDRMSPHRHQKSPSFWGRSKSTRTK